MNNLHKVTLTEFSSNSNGPIGRFMIPDYCDPANYGVWLEFRFFYMVDPNLMQNMDTKKETVLYLTTKQLNVIIDKGVSAYKVKKATNDKKTTEKD